jgi:hypothetical protein
MTFWIDQDNNLHDDMDGEAITLPIWPLDMIEITQQEAGALLAPTPAQLLEQKVGVLKEFISLRERIVSVLTGIAGRTQRAGDLTSALACDAAAESFIGIENTPAFIAAPDSKTAQAIILAASQSIAATLTKASPSAAEQFAAMKLIYP